MPVTSPHLIRLLFALALSGAVPSAVGTAAGAPDRSPTLVEVLRDTEAGVDLAVTAADGRTMSGRFIGASADSLFLTADNRAAPAVGIPLADVGVVRERQSNTGRGASIGAMSGGIALGAFGLLMGSYVATINGEDYSDVAPIVTLTAVGLAAGGLAGGLLGVGVGALTSSYRTIWPLALAEPLPPRDVYSEATRLGLFAGAARSMQSRYEVTRPAANIGLLKSLGENLGLGPEIGYCDFNGAVTTSDLNGTATRGYDSILNLSVAADFHPARRALAPFASVGLGWYLTNDVYVGAHLGGGVRWTASRVTDLTLQMRYNFSLTPPNDGRIDRFWTMGLGFGFGL